VFEACRWRYRETYVYGQPTLPSDPATLGSLAHEAISVYLTQLVARQREQAPEIVAEVWPKFIESRGAALVPERMYADVRWLLEKFAGSFRLDLDRLWDVEIEMAVNAAGEPVEWDATAGFVRGRADLVYVAGQHGEVLDWKTGRATPLSDQEVQNDLQAQTYAMLLSRLNPNLREVRVAFRYPRFNVQGVGIFGQREFDEAWQRWHEIHHAVKVALEQLDDAVVWLPTPGPECAWCPVAMHCPLATDLRSLPVVQDEEYAHVLAGRALALDGASRQIKDALKVWVEKQGPIDVNGIRFDYWPMQSYEYEPNRVAGIAEKHFVEPFSVMKVDREKLLKVGRKNAAFLLDVEATRVDKGRTSFQAKKITGKEDT
jgi:hypothetical protein